MPATPSAALQPCPYFTQSHFSPFLSSFPAAHSAPPSLPGTGCRKWPNGISSLLLQGLCPLLESRPTEGAQNSKLWEGEAEATRIQPLPSSPASGRSSCHGLILKATLSAEGPGQPQSMCPWANGFPHPGLGVLTGKTAGWIL